MKYLRIGVMCGSSEACDSRFLDLAYEVGKDLAINGHEVVYGGGAKGLMRKVADGALDQKGIVHGYMPLFMKEVEWQHPHLTNLHITADMAERKKLMREESDATLFLPGGCGTMEEFFEWLSAKRLGHYIGPLIIYNFENYYDPLIQLLKNMEKESFHNPIHNQMWSICKNISELESTLNNAPSWSANAIDHASVIKK